MLFLLIKNLFANPYQPQNGDIIFHTSLSRQSAAIQIATESPYSHVGIVYIKNNKPYVFEAISTVSSTPLNTWISRGEGQRYMVMRTKKELSQEQLTSMKQEGDSHLGKKYDVKFEWGDEKMYCSELVWKVYEAADIKLSAPHKMKSYNFEDPRVLKELQDRWHQNINWNESVVAPVDLVKSKKLTVVFNSEE
ncbi:MAG: hypothetical protein CMK59_11160 [Proteobacteria bacterium]|nr:hypothetical protein [Pseudomonadota bacterium]